MSLQNFSTNTRIWVYQSPRPFTAEESEWITNAGNEFVSGWNAHGAMMKAEVKLLENRFIVVASDQDFAANSGCSIDKLTAYIRAVQDRTGLNLMDRMLVYYKKDQELVPFHFQQLSELLKEGVITGETIVYNPLVDTLPKFEAEFEKPLKESWLARFAM